MRRTARHNSTPIKLRTIICFLANIRSHPVECNDPFLPHISVYPSFKESPLSVKFWPITGYLHCVNSQRLRKHPFFFLGTDHWSPCLYNPVSQNMPVRCHCRQRGSCRLPKAGRSYCCRKCLRYRSRCKKQECPLP